MTETADVLVIGGGVLGAAIVYELASRGLRVALTERDMPNRQGSGATAGNLHIQAIHARRPHQEVPVDTAKLVPFQRAASDLWMQLEDRLGTSLDVTLSGGLTVAESEDEIQMLKEKAVWESAAGISTEILDTRAVHELMPELGHSVRAATWCARDGYANALLATPAYLSAAKKQGATVRTHSPVRALSQAGDSWTVVTDTGSLSVGAVVNAAGPWIPQISALAGHELSMNPVAIQMHETVRAPRLINFLVQHIGRGLSVKQVASGNVIIGGGWPAGEINLSGVSAIREESVDGNMAEAIRIVPLVESLRLSRVWAGPLAATPDEMPIVGEFGQSGLFTAGGTYAFTFSPLWAQITADLVTRSEPRYDVSDFTPERLLAEVREEL